MENKFVLYLKMCRPLCSWVTFIPCFAVILLAMIYSPTDSLVYLRLFLGLIAAVNLQHFANIADDLNCYRSGVDDHRESWKPAHYVKTGEVSEKDATMFLALTAAIIGISGSLAILLTPSTTTVRIIIFAIGLASLAVAFAYSWKPKNGKGLFKKPYGFVGLGELVSFIFFGPVMIVGMFYLFMGEDLFALPSAFHFSIFLGVLFGIPVILLMMINNIRDIESDLKGGKKTFCNIIGQNKSLIVFSVLLVLEIFLANPYLFIDFTVGMQCFLTTIPLIIVAVLLNKSIRKGEYLSALLKLAFFEIIILITLLVQFLLLSIILS